MQPVEEGAYLHFRVIVHHWQKLSRNLKQKSHFLLIKYCVVMVTSICHIAQEHAPRADAAHSGLRLPMPINHQDKSPQMCPHRWKSSQLRLHSQGSLGCVKLMVWDNQAKEWIGN